MKIRRFKPIAPIAVPRLIRIGMKTYRRVIQREKVLARPTQKAGEK